MENKRFNFTDLDAYKISFELSNKVWSIVKDWDNLSKNTVGNQLIRAIDSISANIAEGFGKYTKKDKINFYRHSCGSLNESMDWIEKSKTRKLINEKQYEYLKIELDKLPKLLNQLIYYTNKNLSH